MNPARFASRYAGAVVLITVLLVTAGVVAAFGLASSIYPPLEFPRVIIIGRSGTTPARSMLLTVTRTLEQAAMSVPGIRRVRSKTFRGTAEISAQFAPGTNMLLALQQVQNRVAETRGTLPADAELTVERLTPETFPILSLNLTGALPTADLRDYAFYVMRPELARVPGVGRVDVMASDTREIEVVTDPSRLLAAGLTVPEVAAALRASNLVSPVGRYAFQGRQYLVLASALWSTIEDIAHTPIAVRQGGTLRVSDVASVWPGAPDRTSLVTGDGHDAAVINLSQQVGASILVVKQGVDQAVATLSRTLPANLQITKVYDLAEFVASSIANVRDAILIGGFLAIVVLFAFLRNWRVTVAAALTLPLTVGATFLFMRLLGESINLMSMGGLAVAIGLVIDDAVVVVENIHRRMAETREAEAIEQATSELVAPVVGSTLTTVVVFAPLGLLSGVVGQFFRALSLTLSVAVLLSLALALTLIPLLSRWGYHGGDSHRGHGTTGGALDRGYSRTLGAAMHRPWLVGVGALVLAVIAALLYLRMPTGFLPEMDEGGFVVDYLTPAGTALEETDRQVRRVEQIIAATPEVSAFSRRTGSELGLFATQQNKGDILVRLKPGSQRARSAAEVIADLRPRLQAAVPTLSTEFVQILQDMIGDLEGAPTPIEVKIFGDDLDVLERLAHQAETIVAQVPGVVDLVGVQRGNPEVTWEVDPVAVGRLGLTVDQVAGQLSAAWLGDATTNLRLFDRNIPVRVRYADAYRFDPAKLPQTSVRSADGKLSPIGTLGRPVASNGQSVLTRENLRQMALLTARLGGTSLGSAVADIQTRLRALQLPVGYTFEVGGQYQAQRQAFTELLMVFGVAASLVFTILVIQFRAFTPALLILIAAPLSFGAAFALLLATGTELNVSSAMGLILLVGLVVKNGIVLIDYAHRLHDAGTPFADAVAQAGRVRLRPILMTTLCTLFGLLPLALGLGSGAELQKPLALTVIGGLSLSTVITLYAVPSLYVALHRERA